MWALASPAKGHWGTCPPPLTEIKFLKCTLTGTKSDSDWPYVDSNFCMCMCPSWHQILATPLLGVGACMWSVGAQARRVRFQLPLNLTPVASPSVATAGSSSWCPKIYFNYRCFTGPYLSKGRLMLLPQSVGPGPVSLVVREVLSMIINVAYKSSRVLRELQLDGAPNPSMQQQILGAKYVMSASLPQPFYVFATRQWVTLSFAKTKV